jgi:hypothetical protein
MIDEARSFRPSLRLRLAPAATLLLALAGPAAAASPVPSLCTREEKPLIRWATKGSDKLVSLCASPDFGKGRGSLQYRFGRPDKIELRFPASSDGSHEQFVYSHYFRARFDQTSLSFVHDGYRYTLHDDYDGEQGKPVKSTSVTVEPLDGKGRSVEIHCRELAPSDLAALGDALPNHDADE